MMMVDDDNDSGGVVPHRRRFSLSDRGMAVMAELLPYWHCHCRRRLRLLSEVALRRGLVLALTMMVSARGRGDR